MIQGAVKDPTEHLWERLTDKVGGPARRRVVLLLGAVLSLQSADAGTVGAVGVQLEKAFRIGNTELGLLITVTSLVGALMALPVGVLADRSNRARLLSLSTALWALSMVAGGVSSSYVMLLCTRLALGLVTAAAAPLTASLTGDLFPAKERSRIYGMVLTGELLGAGVGLVVSSDIADVAGWRAPFFMLGAASAALCYALYRLLPEPARGGQSWLRLGAEEILAADDVQGEASTTGESVTAPSAPGRGVSSPARTADNELRRRAQRRPDIDARPGLVVKEDPSKMSLGRAARYIVSIPSNLVLIATSVLGYFFLAGLRSFAVIFTESHYEVSQAAVSFILIPIGVGAVVGTITGGRYVDALIQRDKIDARIFVPGICFVAASAVFIPALVSTALFISMPLYSAAAAFLTAPNPALDAARLDVVPSLLWGRGEAVRTFARSILEAFAPLSFGYLSSVFGGRHASFGSNANTRASANRASLAESHGLEYTFLIMLVPLLISGIVLILARRTYLRDVVTADQSDRVTWRAPQNPPLRAGAAQRRVCRDAKGVIAVVQRYARGKDI